MLGSSACLFAAALIGSTLATNQVVLTCGTGNEEQGPGLPGPPGELGPRGETGPPGPPGPKGAPCSNNDCASSLEELQRRMIAYENETARLSLAVEEIRSLVDQYSQNRSENSRVEEISPTEQPGDGRSENLTGQWFFPGNGYRYHIKVKKMTFDNAESYCQTLGGHLAEKRLGERSVLRFLRGSMRTTNILRAFIGLKLSRGSWKWIDGTSAANVPWYNGQPSGDGPCAQLLEERNSFGVNDIRCTGVWTQGVLCEVRLI